MSTISMPTSPAAKSIEWSLSDVQGANRSSFSLQQQTFDWQQAVLRASVSIPPMLPPQAAAWEAFLMYCYGIKNSFMFGDPVRTKPQTPGASGGSCAAAASGANTLAISSSGMLPGDWIQIGVRLYRLVGGTDGGFNIWPPVREAIPGGTSVQVTNTQGLFRLSKNDRKYSVNQSKVYGVTFELEEYL